MIIYKCTNMLNGHCYIGQTCKGLEYRKQRHYEEYSSGTGFKFHDALRSYGWDNFEWQIIDTATSLDELNTKENYWVTYYDSMNNGYNMTEGGEANPMYSEQVIEKHLSKVQSKEYRLRVSVSMKAYIKKNGFSVEHRQKISQALKGNQHFKGHKLSESHRKALFEARDKAMQTFTHTEECKQRIKTNIPHRKGVIQIDKVTGEVLNTFLSLRDAGRWVVSNGMSRTKDYETAGGGVGRACETNKIMYGYKWEYDSK